MKFFHLNRHLRSTKLAISAGLAIVIICSWFLVESPKHDEKVPVVMYAKLYCPYCRAAKFFLQEKGVSFTTIDISANPEKRDEMIRRSHGRTSVPQIFIGSTHIGGFDDLLQLESHGQFSELLKEIASSK